MPVLRDAYANSTKSGFTIDFFSLTAPGAKEAFLASPFYCTYEPIKTLTERGCLVKLIVRLCTITTPAALKLALDDPRVSIRFYTDQRFHAKFYIIDENALVGSANLTDAGLKANRELSIVLQRGRDSAFEELPGLFDLLWDYADVLTGDILEKYRQAFSSSMRPKGEDDFDVFLQKYVEKCAPPTIRVGSEKVSKKRSFLQSFRRKYDEVLIPAFKEIRNEFARNGQRRREFASGDLNIEVSRFLGWLRVVHAPGESWSDTGLLEAPARLSRLQTFMSEWFKTGDIENGDMIQVSSEISNIEAIRNNFSSDALIASQSYDEIFETLNGCHAFHEMLRFTKGGVEGLRKDFAARNTLKSIQATISYLAHGSGDEVQRAYDCITDEQYRLSRFGEACVMELLGWLSEQRPPINGRTIKALRFLGFDTKSYADQAD